MGDGSRHFAMHMKNRSLALVLVHGMLALGNGCSASSGSGRDAAVGANGGFAATGGVTAIGGASTSGGAIGSGGALATGGDRGSGGAVPSGGATGSGGASTATGSANTGGSTGKGSAASGGVSGTGISTATGGGPATGGATAVGGAVATGGIRATGGATATGGVVTTGGAGGTRDAGSSADASLGDGKVGTGGSSGSPDSAGTGGTISSPTTGAPETKPLGYGQATTGGGAASPVTDASSLSALQAAIDAYAGSGGLSLRYTGKFDSATIGDPCTQWNLPAQVLEIKKKNDITLVGAELSAANFGIHIASSSSNIIVRNMTMALLPGGDASDAITLEGMSGGVPSNIWIDHNTLYSSMVDCAGAGDTAFDGLIDIKKGADNVTVSYNFLHDHHKVSLNGYSDSDTAPRHVTFHHNIFENIGSRTPLQRGGHSHLLNNLFSGVTTSGINVRMDGYSLIEGNYFENVKNPVTSRDSSAIGYWELRGNNLTSPADFTKYGITWVASDSTPSVDATDWKTTATFPVALGYTYAVDAPQCLKDGLHSVAGAGKGLATLKCR